MVKSGINEVVQENSGGGDSGSADDNGNAHFTEILLCAKYNLRVSPLVLSHLIVMAASKQTMLLSSQQRCPRSLNSVVAEAELKLIFNSDCGVLLHPKGMEGVISWQAEEVLSYGLPSQTVSLPSLKIS